MLEKKEELLEEPVSPDRGDVGTLLATHTRESSLRAIEELLDGVEELGEPPTRAQLLEVWGEHGEDVPVALRVWKLDLSRGTKYRLLEKRKKIDSLKDKPLHYKQRRKKYREHYWKYARAGCLKAKSLRTTTPRGLYIYYRGIASQRKMSWDMDEDKFIEIMLRPAWDGVPIYKKIFNVLRRDKSIGYSIDNITIVDRYDSSIIYY